MNTKTSYYTGLATDFCLAKSDYRFGFNGQEKINEVFGEGNFLDFKYRGADPRLGRFFAVDPLTKSYPELTPYQFASNTPIWARELEGLEANYTTEGKTKSDEFGKGSNNDVAGPLSESRAEELGYTKYGVIEHEKVKEFTPQEISDFTKFNSADGQTNPDACIGVGTNGCEYLTGAETGLKKPNTNEPYKNENAYSLGKKLESTGYATRIPTLAGNETQAIKNTSGNTNGNYTAFLEGPGYSHHTIIILYNSSNVKYSIYDQGTGWDKKNSSSAIIQGQINEIQDRYDPAGNTRLWQLNKLTNKEVIYNR